MNILVLASATRSSGALTIYKQFLSHLPNYVEENRYYIFVDHGMPQPVINNVVYIYDSDHSYKHRMYMDRKGYMEEMRNRGVMPDVIFSLQNTGCVTNCKQVIYYHQPLPFYPQKWNPFRKAERTMFLYKYIYPFFVKRTLNKDTEIIVQIPFIKKGFVKRFNYDPEKVHVVFPDMGKIDVSSVISYDFDNGGYNFVFPATAPAYKGHLTIAKALEIIKYKDKATFDEIRIHLTIGQRDNKELSDYIRDYELSNSFVFHGSIPHSRLLAFYKGARALLFPSTIETLGLPLLEASAFGLPIVASDLDYAHEVTNGYEGVAFVHPKQYDKWADNILKLCYSNNTYPQLKFETSEWPKVFNTILNNKS